MTARSKNLGTSPACPHDRQTWSTWDQHVIIRRCLDCYTELPPPVAAHSTTKGARIAMSHDNAEHAVTVRSERRAGHAKN